MVNIEFSTEQSSYYNDYSDNKNNIDLNYSR